MNSKLTHYDISYGGVPNDIIINSDKSELKEALYNFMEDSGITKINVMPNFSLGSILGPSGYVAEVALNQTFTTAMLHQPVFRFVSFFEILFDNERLTKIKTDDWKDVIRKTIPLSTPFYPRLTDTYDSPWSPALGQYGSNIGIYSFEEKVGNERIKRFFIGVHSGLHLETYDLLMHHLTVQCLYKNSDLINQPNASSNGGDAKILTYNDVFGDTGIMKKMRDIAKENNRRLAVQLAKTLSIHFKDREVINAISEITALHQGDNTHALNALRWWKPPESIGAIPMYLDSVVYHSIYEDDIDAMVESRIKPKAEIRAMPIGLILRDLRKAATSVQQIDALKEFENITLLEKRGTIIPTIESEYNTYRIKGPFLVIYNGCCPTLTEGKYPYTCVIRQQSIFQGYEILNSTLSKNDQEQHKTESTQWTNNFGSGYPAVPNLEKRKEATVKIETSQANIFFSAYNNIHANRKDIPKQVKYVPSSENWSDGLIKRDLYSPLFTPNCIELVPEFVYLSPDIHIKSLDMIRQ